MIVSEALRAAAARLEPGNESPRLDAEVLLAHVLGWTRTLLLVAADDPVSDDHQRQFQALVEKREAREPIAYLTGVQEFWSLPLRVTPDVLIPRQETELLVETVLDRLADRPAPRIADLGTGSGAVALALASERSDAHIWATDLQPAALDVARANAEQLGLGDIRFVLGYWLQPLADQRFDAIVSNPPYIADSDPHLDALIHEPRTALTAGSDGLRDLRAIVAAAPACLEPGGWLAVEHGWEQGAAVRELMRQSGLERVETHRDLGGMDRVSTGQNQ